MNTREKIVELIESRGASTVGEMAAELNAHPNWVRSCCYTLRRAERMECLAPRPGERQNRWGLREPRENSGEALQQVRRGRWV